MNMKTSQIQVSVAVAPAEALSVRAELTGIHTGKALARAVVIAYPVSPDAPLIVSVAAADRALIITPDAPLGFAMDWYPVEKAYAC